MEFFGIDFGTTNSAVVGRLRRNTTNYGDDQGQPFPSLVAVNNVTGEIHAVGREAWNNRQQLAESCRILTSAKTHLGEGIKWKIGPEIWTPERVVTEILRELKNQVKERGNGTCLDKTVIAIPVGFSPVKRKALRKAADKAGIEVSGFVSEPTAALFRNYQDLQHWPYVAVFDWGGGTLDISVVHIQDSIVHEIATVPKRLGGDDLDQLLAEWTHAKIIEQKGSPSVPFLSMNSRYRDVLLAHCETAKRTLANDDKFTISILRYGDYGTVNISITKDQFVGLIQPKIDEALQVLEEGVVHRAHLSFDQVHILLVGGSSKLRGLQQTMAQRGWQFSLPADSDWHVADGAAILASNFGEYIASQNVGVLLSDNTVFPIVREGDSINSLSGSMTFGMVEDTDHARLIFVETQGSVTGPPRTLDYISVPAFGFPNELIKTDWRIDDDLLLSVSAKSERRGQASRKRWTYDELRFAYKLPGNNR